jgi:hypothetical protein
VLRTEQKDARDKEIRGKPIHKSVVLESVVEDRRLMAKTMRI